MVLTAQGTQTVHALADSDCCLILLDTELLQDFRSGQKGTNDRLWTKRRATRIRKPFKGLLQAAPWTLSQHQGFVMLGGPALPLRTWFSSVKGLWCNKWLLFKVATIKCPLKYPYSVAWHTGLLISFGFCFWSTHYGSPGWNPPGAPTSLSSQVKDHRCAPPQSANAINF